MNIMFILSKFIYLFNFYFLNFFAQIMHRLFLNKTVLVVPLSVDCMRNYSFKAHFGFGGELNLLQFNELPSLLFFFF